jgi:hypothetical protein
MTFRIGEESNAEAKIVWPQTRLDQAARMFSERNFFNANGLKCHPEPAAKDLAAAKFCGRDLPGFGGLARSVWNQQQAGKSLSTQRAELRRWLRMTSLLGPNFFRFRVNISPA